MVNKKTTKNYAARVREKNEEHGRGKWELLMELFKCEKLI